MNKTVITEQLLQTIWACDNALTPRNDHFLTENETRLNENLARVAIAFSGSWLGYHANVYYKDLQAPPPGSHFSQEWGLNFGDSIGNWIEYSRESVRAAIMADVDPEYKNKLGEASKQAKQLFDDKYETVCNILDALLAESKTSTLQRIHGDVNNIDLAFTAQKVVEEWRPKGPLMTRDTTAAAQGTYIPVHCIVEAEQIAMLRPFDDLELLAGYARRILKYMQINDLIERSSVSMGNKVFIGHGRSVLWREFKDFIKDRLHLDYEEFNRQPTAGMSILERIQQMLDSACFAFLIMTAEDQHADQSMHARENVIHEVGLFQGRLDFRKAIVVLEEGCSEFSNINGLTQIRFPKGNIKACFEEVRRVLEREGIV